MRALVHRTGLAGALVALAAGCTSGNSAIQPPYQSVNISTTGKLQFAVGTAAVGLPPPSSGPATAQLGLNTVVTFRKADGTSAFAVNMPVITGPPGFVVPNVCQAGIDGGTNHISGLAQMSSARSTFGTTGQAALYGFGPNNYNVSGSTPFGNYSVPFYAAAASNSSNCSSSSSGSYPATAFYGVAPAFPSTSVASFAGYNLGFVDFLATPVSGTYGLAVTVPTSPGSSQGAYTYHALAALNATRVLPVFTAASFNPNTSGGGTVSVKLPAGTREAYAQLSDSTSGATFGFAFHSSSSQALGAGSMSPCDSFELVAVGFDYPALEAAAPKNTAQTPPIVGSHGQSDVTVSFPAVGQMPPASSSSGCSSSGSSRVRRKDS
jgi:hypothetical protein